jgi:hypothetical protein
MTTASNESSPDAIIESIHLVFQQLPDEHGGDLRAYFEAALKRQHESQRNVVSRPPAGSKDQ